MQLGLSLDEGHQLRLIKVDSYALDLGIRLAAKKKSNWGKSLNEGKGKSKHKKSTVLE